MNAGIRSNERITLCGDPDDPNAVTRGKRGVGALDVSEDSGAIVEIDVGQRVRRCSAGDRHAQDGRREDRCSRTELRGHAVGCTERATLER